MERTERIALGVAVIGHIGLFAILSYTLIPRETVPRREAVAVTLSDDIAEFATATDRPAPASEERAMEDDLQAMVPQEIEPLPQPRVTPTPTPTPTPRRTVERRTEPTPRRETQPERREPARTRRSRVTGITEGIGTTTDTGTSASNAPVSASDRSNIMSRIIGAYRPCYRLGSLSGTAAEDIVVRLRMRPSREGRLSSSQVEIEGYRGVDASNRQYQQQMGEAARSAVLNPACSFPTLPASMYENGWSDVIINFIPGQLT